MRCLSERVYCPPNEKKRPADILLGGAKLKTAVAT
jgi:hypothetical protein